jgi:ABC-type phosphate/phosphonate transport system substrate-binding protein
MSSSIHRARIGALVVVFSVASLPLLAEEKKDSIIPLKAGISRSVFFKQPEWVAQAALPMWSTLVKSQAGIETEFHLVDADQLGQQLADRELGMAVFQGHEFAWAAQKDRQLRALVIVVNEKPYLHAAFVVRQDAKAKSIADFQGQTVAFHRGSQPQSLFTFG